jgi:hypothetical protein
MDPPMTGNTGRIIVLTATAGIGREHNGRSTTISG